MRFSSCVIVLLLALPTSAQAQVARIAPAPSPLFARNASKDATARPTPPDTHWQTGAIAGGVVVGLLGAGFGQGLCEMSETTRNCSASLLGGALVGAVLGATVGALIGGQFPK